MPSPAFVLCLVKCPVTSAALTVLTVQCRISHFHPDILRASQWQTLVAKMRPQPSPLEDLCCPSLCSEHRAATSVPQQRWSPQMDPSTATKKAQAAHFSQQQQQIFPQPFRAWLEAAGEREEFMVIFFLFFSLGVPGD